MGSQNRACGRCKNPFTFSKLELAVIAMSQQVINSSGDDNIVAVRQLTKRYKDGTEALKGITLNVKKGDLFGLIGPDGRW